MGTILLPSLTDAEEEVIRLLVEIGLKTGEARLLVVFFRGLEPTSRDLERITDLRQPEVSVGITSLSKRKWVCVSNLLPVHKGRPIKIYSLAWTIDEILDAIRDGIATGHDQQAFMLRRIREIIRN